MTQIREVFWIRSRGVVAVCREPEFKGTLGDTVTIVKEDKTILTATINGIERFDHMTMVNKSLGIYLKGINKGDISPGDAFFVK